ncbi:MAG: hypothetical protein LH468_09760 [Nocardioides sp.]|nr:hypothetical protein [Nocardioides sp.]
MSRALLPEPPERRRPPLHVDSVGRLDPTGTLPADALHDVEAAGRAFQDCGARAHSARLPPLVLDLLITADHAEDDVT